MSPFTTTKDLCEFKSKEDVDNHPQFSHLKKIPRNQLMRVCPPCCPPLNSNREPAPRHCPLGPTQTPFSRARTSAATGRGQELYREGRTEREEARRSGKQTWEGRGVGGGRFPEETAANLRREGWGEDSAPGGEDTGTRLGRASLGLRRGSGTPRDQGQGFRGLWTPGWILKAVGSRRRASGVEWTWLSSNSADLSGWLQCGERPGCGGVGFCLVWGARLGGCGKEGRAKLVW